MTRRIGWIGCGRHATQMLLPQLVRQDVVLTALCDVDEGALARAARQYGVQRLHRDYRELLGQGGLDALGMAVGPAEHVLIALDALGRGLPVFMEKPPGASRADAERIAEAAERARMPVTLGFMKRYATGNKIARNLIAAPEFGPTLGFYGSYMTAPTYFAGAVDYAPFYLHHCVHYMDLPSWLMGAAITEMEARVVESTPGHLLIHLGLCFANGAIGTLVMGTIQSRGTPMEFVQIMGDHRRVEVTNVIEVEYHRNPPFKAEDPGASLADAVDTLRWRPNFTAAANEDHKGYATLLADVVAAWRGERSAAPTIADGIAAMANLDRFRAAVEAQLARR